MPTLETPVPSSVDVIGDPKPVEDGKKLDQTVGLGFGLVAVSGESEEQNSTLVLSGNTEGEQPSEDKPLSTAEKIEGTVTTDSGGGEPALQLNGNAGENQLSEITPSVTTDKDDYAPGETATITAESFDGAAAPLLPIEYLASGPLNDPVTFNAPADSNINPDKIAKKAAAGTPVSTVASAMIPLGEHLGRHLEHPIARNPSTD